MSGTHTYGWFGSYSVTVAVENALGTVGTSSGTAAVKDAELTVTALDIQPTQGQPFSGAVATFADANPESAVAGKIAAYLMKCESRSLEK